MSACSACGSPRPGTQPTVMNAASLPIFRGANLHSSPGQVPNVDRAGAGAGVVVAGRLDDPAADDDGAVPGARGGGPRGRERAGGGRPDGDAAARVVDVQQAAGDDRAGAGGPVLPHHAEVGMLGVDQLI